MGGTVRPPLTRRRILEAALQLVDREGVAALSMRRLGRELGVEAMSLYHHVPHKEALLDGIVELLVAEVHIPPPGAGPWEALQRAIARSYRRMAHAHPRAFPLVATRPLTTPGALGRRDAVLAIFRAAGFDRETAYRGFRTLASYASGYALDEITRQARVAAASPPAPVAHDGDAEFEFGLDLIFAGLRALLEDRPPTP